MTELRVFHAGGYRSLKVEPERCFDAALDARFVYGDVRMLILIQWEPVGENGEACACWRWERTQWRMR